MTTLLEIDEAKTRWDEVVARANAGEEIIIAKAGRPMVRLVSAEPPARVFGAYKGRVVMADDFNDPLPPDVQAGFEK